MIGKPAPAIELPSVPKGDLYKVPFGEKVGTHQQSGRESSLIYFTRLANRALLRESTRHCQSPRSRADHPYPLLHYRSLRTFPVPQSLHKRLCERSLLLPRCQSRQYHLQAASRSRGRGHFRWCVPYTPPPLLTSTPLSLFIRPIPRLDDTTKQTAFADQHKLPYPIVSDTGNKVRQAYKVDSFMFGLAPGQSAITSALCGHI